MQEICPQCLKAMTGTASRLVQDSCGHRKCRICLLIEENGCQLCESQVVSNNVDAKRLASNIRFDKLESETHKSILDIKNDDLSNSLVLGKRAHLNSEISVSPCTVIANNFTKNPVRKECNHNEVQNVKLPRFKVEEHNEHILKTRLECPDETVDTIYIENDRQSIDIKHELDDSRSSEISDIEGKIKKIMNKSILPDYFVHISDDPLSYNCTICNKIFSNKSHIKKHLVNISSKQKDIDENIPVNVTKNEKTMECTECGQKFAKRSHLEWHERSHTGERPFECMICGKTFTQKGKLNRHINAHSGIKKYICDKCDKRFSTKESLRSHERIHLGIKRFRCQHCPSSFTEQSNLNKHMTIHTKDRPFMCDECGKTFSLKWRLTVHSRSHNRIRTHQCPQCPRAFSNSKDMHRHLVIHSGTKPFSCNLCNTDFRRKDNLERHMRNSHPDSRVASLKKSPMQQKSSAKLNTPVKTASFENSQDDSDKKEVPQVENKSTVIERLSNNSVDKTNAVNVIKPQTTVITSNANYKSEEKHMDQFKQPLPPKSNAVPVINGPVKLAFKTSAFKNSYNIKNKDFVIDDNVNIYQKILSPMGASQSKDKLDQTRALCADSIIKSTDKERESDLLRHKMSSRISVPRIHYETSFEHSTHSIIKNIKFKLPPEYTSQASKFNLRNKNEDESENINKVSNCSHEEQNPFNELNLDYVGLSSTKPVKVDQIVDLPTNNANLTPLTSVFLIDKNNEEIADRDNCVRTITKASSNITSYTGGNMSQMNNAKGIHWRKRTSQSLQSN